MFSNPLTNREFNVVTGFAYGDQFSEVQALGNEVESYANLIVLNSPALTFNRTAVDQYTYYIFNSGLSFIVRITDSNMYNASSGYPIGNTIFFWIGNASQKYGNKLLGIYRFDEPGGNQLDR